MQQQELQRCKHLAMSGKSSTAGEKLYVEMMLGGEDQDSTAYLSPAQQAALTRYTLCFALLYFALLLLRFALFCFAWLGLAWLCFAHVWL